MSEREIVIVKIGSNALIGRDGDLNEHVIRETLLSLKEAVREGCNVLLVSSGAVKRGKYLLQGIDVSTSVLASIGQIELVCKYQKEAKRVGITLAELLLARPYLVRRKQFLNLQETIEKLFTNKIIPLVNENDALVSGTDWSFGDNDSLAAALAIALEARRLIIISHIDGLFDKDPAKEKNTVLIREVDDVNYELMKYSSKSVSSGGRGGMISKLKAARICNAFGIEVRIINGLERDNLSRALHDLPVGTFFKPKRSFRALSSRERWLLVAKNSSGSIEIDHGAVEALKDGKSLLAVGVRKVYGQFQKKEIIEIVDMKRQGVAFGIVDFSKNDIETMLRTKNTHGKQLMHADNIIFLAT
jgi:glutamate 5-kinase